MVCAWFQVVGVKVSVVLAPGLPPCLWSLTFAASPPRRRHGHIRRRLARQHHRVAPRGPALGEVESAGRDRHARRAGRGVIVGDGEGVGRRVAERVARAVGQRQHHRLVALDRNVVVDADRDGGAGSSGRDRQCPGTLDGEVLAAPRRRRAVYRVAQREPVRRRRGKVHHHLVRAGALGRVRRRRGEGRRRLRRGRVGGR